MMCQLGSFAAKGLFLVAAIGVVATVTVVNGVRHPIETAERLYSVGRQLPAAVVELILDSKAD